MLKSDTEVTLLRQEVTTIVKSVFVAPVQDGIVSSPNLAQIAQLPGFIRNVTMPSTPDGIVVIETVTIRTRQTYPSSDPLGTRPLTFHP